MITSAHVEAYITLAALVIVAFCFVAFFTLVISTIPRGIRAVRKNRGSDPASVYARWQLFRYSLYAWKLFFFIVPAVNRILHPEQTPLSRGINVTALLFVAVGIAVGVMTEPLAQRRVDRAIAATKKRPPESPAEADARHAGRDMARDIGRDPVRDGHRDIARDKAHDAQTDNL